MAGIVRSDRVVALPSPRLHLRGVWAAVCHYPQTPGEISHIARLACWGPKCQSRREVFKLSQLGGACSSRPANTHRHICKQPQRGHAFTHACSVTSLNTHMHACTHARTHAHTHSLFFILPRNHVAALHLRQHCNLEGMNTSKEQPTGCARTHTQGYCKFE